MPLTHSKPGSPGFSRNIAEMVKSGHPVKQAVAAAYSAAGERSRDAMPSSVRILGGSDPTGSQDLVPVPRAAPYTPAGAAQNAGLPAYTQMPEPYPQQNLPATTYSKSVYPQPRVAIPVVGGEEVAVKDADFGSAMGSAIRSAAGGAPVSSPSGGSSGSSSGSGTYTGGWSVQPSSTGGMPTYQPSSSDGVYDDEAQEAEGEGMLENSISSMHGGSSSGGGMPQVDVGATSVVNGKKTGYEIDTTDDFSSALFGGSSPLNFVGKAANAMGGNVPVTPSSGPPSGSSAGSSSPPPSSGGSSSSGSSSPSTPQDSFAEVEKNAAKEYGSEEAGKRVAAAVGFKNLGKKEMERRAEAGKK